MRRLAAPLLALALAPAVLLADGSRPAPDLAPGAHAAFLAGEAHFGRHWPLGPGPAAPVAARTCASCHIDAGRSDRPALPDVAAGTVRYPDGTRVALRRPAIPPAHGADIPFGPRTAPAVWAAPAIQAVPEAQIEAWADPGDADGDGISGRIRWGFSLAAQDIAPGRFGWKATAPMLADQVANAFATDMGLSTPLIRANPACAGPAADCLSAAGVAPPLGNGIDPAAFDLVVFYAAALAVPAFTGAPDLFDRGAALFDAVGCAGCHKRRYDAGVSAAHAPPYSDLLLHDLGPDLADSRPQGSISASEWRTAPLTGLGQTLRSNPQAGFLHDGRARTVEEAVLWHGGEAQPARDAFVTLPARDRILLLAFLQNL